VYVSDMPADIIEKMHMTPAKTLDEAIKIAKSFVKSENPQIVAIPDGVSVIVKNK
jgi:hypothetical protein